MTLVIDHEPFDLEREIAAIVAPVAARHRARQECRAHVRGIRACRRRAALVPALGREYLAAAALAASDLRIAFAKRHELPILCALTFSVTLGVACIAELRLAGWM